MTHNISFYSGNSPHIKKARYHDAVYDTCYSFFGNVTYIAEKRSVLLYTQTLLHTEAFAQKHFHTQRLLHIEAFTHKRFYTQTFLTTDTFTHTHAFLLHTATLSHTEAFIRKILSLQTLEISKQIFWLFLHFLPFFAFFCIWVCHFGFALSFCIMCFVI
jgi:hypothetical protein